MRIGIECQENVMVGDTGSIRIEMYRAGLSALSDEREYKIVDQPEQKQRSSQANLPDFELIPVTGPSSEHWENVCEDPEDTDVRRHASNFVMNDGVLYIYYSESFPRFATEVRRFEQQSAALASSFRSRYETWLAVHSLLMHQDEISGESPDIDEEAAYETNRQERLRLAVIAAMVASQEVTHRALGEDEDNAAA